MSALTVLWALLRVFSALFMIALTVALFRACAWLASPRRKRRSEIRQLPALRFARGEISAETCRIMRSDLIKLK